MARLIRRRCSCGCGGITNYGKRWISGHNPVIFSTKTRKKISRSKIGNTYGRGNKGKVRSEETKKEISISKLKYNPNYKYCDVWKDNEYKNDLRKDYCENVNCKGNNNQLDNHHINLNKKECKPFNIMTLCHSCHAWLHNKLFRQKNRLVSTRIQDYLITIREDRIVYIHKKTRYKIVIKRIIK